jgi:hypothetical protein
MLQTESRKILYGDDDPWNQTSADNPEWLNLFKKAHGIDSQAPVTGTYMNIDQRLSGHSILKFTGINAHHEVYEDLGIHSGTTVDPSFNVNNFPCATLAENDPMRALSFEFALSGTINHFQDAQRTSSGRQTPYSLPGLTASSTSSASYAPVTTATSTEQLLGIYEPISELACTSEGIGGPCFGESGEVGFATKTAGSAKRRYWLDEQNAHMAPFMATIEKPVYERSSVGLRSFEPINEQACAAAGEPIQGDFEFPSWDELPVDLKNPTSSAGFDSAIPISTAGVSLSAIEGTTSMLWDDTEMNFDMDMDMDLDLDLDLAQV